MGSICKSSVSVIWTQDPNYEHKVRKHFHAIYFPSMLVFFGYTYSYVYTPDYKGEFYSASCILPVSRDWHVTYIVCLLPRSTNAELPLSPLSMRKNSMTFRFACSLVALLRASPRRTASQEPVSTRVTWQQLRLVRREAWVLEAFHWCPSASPTQPLLPLWLHLWWSTFQRLILGPKWNLRRPCLPGRPLPRHQISSLRSAFLRCNCPLI
jgi:hypothetical protein